MILKFEYLEHINKRNMTLSFDFRKAVNLSLVQIPLSSQTINILPDNGH